MGHHLMTETEFTVAARWVVAAIFVGVLLVYGPALISAASSDSVMAGLFLGGACVLGAALSVTARLDTYYRKFYAMVRDAFFT